MMLFDTHTHLTDSRFDEDRESLIESLPGQGVALAVDVVCDLGKAADTIALIERYPFLYATAGVHPHDAGNVKPGYLDGIAALLRHERMLALGEIGLDYHYDFSPRDVQRRVFAEQLEYALQERLPVVLHIREAFGDCMDILRAHKDGLHGVMHCFSGSYEIAKECLNMGLYISFGGAVTFHNANNQREIAAKLPLERIVIETDCPYLTPVPYRGRRNSPAYVRLVAEKIAEVRGMDAEEVAAATFENGTKLYRVL